MADQKLAGISDELKELFRRYAVTVIDYKNLYDSIPRDTVDDIREAQRYNPYDSDKIAYSVYYNQVRSFILSVPETALNALAKENEYYSKQLSKDSLELLDELIKARQFEKTMRMNNPLVREAWERYIVLLSLACKQNSSVPRVLDL